MAALTFYNNFGRILFYVLWLPSLIGLVVLMSES